MNHSEAPVAPSPRAGGLRRGGQGAMPPLLAILLAIGALEVLLLVLLPWLLAHGTDSLWVQSERLAHLALAVLGSTVFGALAGVSAERRGHSPWWALLGHVGSALAPCLAAFGLVETSPLVARLAPAMAGTLGALLPLAWKAPEKPWEPGRGTQELSRVAYALGNIWLGISLLAVLAGAIWWGSWVENAYGHKAAMAMIYTSGWLGFVFFAFTVSLVAATLRKYPWRVDQTGWIVVHIALVLVIVGSMMSFWAKREGELVLGEGEASSSFLAENQTRLVLEEAREVSGRLHWRKLDEAICRFDGNPAAMEPREKTVLHGPADQTFEVEVARWLPDARKREQLSNTAKEPLFGVAGNVTMPGAGMSRPFTLSEDGGETGDPSLLSMACRRVQDEAAATMLKQPEAGFGALEVLDAADKVLLRVPLEPGEVDAKLQARPLSFDVELPGTGIHVHGKALYANWQLTGTTADRTPVDASPDDPRNPAIALTLNGPRGEDVRWAFAWYPDLLPPTPERNVYSDLRVRLRWFVMPRGALWFVTSGSSEPFWAFRSRSGEIRHGALVAGQALDLGIPLTITPTEVFSHLDRKEVWDFAGYVPQQSVAEVRITHAGGSTKGWLPLQAEPITFESGDEMYRLRWQRTREALPFNLKLHDFRRDFYPGSANESTFESYLRINDAERFREGADIKIDMNHPLRYQGWRLFQARYSTEGGETTILQVNRDPGLAVIYPACALLTLGMVLVFFQKPFLRQLGQWAAKRSPLARFGASQLAIALGLVSTLPGVLVISLLPAGPVQGLGALAIALGIVLESLWVLRWLGPRLVQPQKEVS